MTSLIPKILAAASLLALAECLPAQEPPDKETDKVLAALQAEVEDLLKQSEKPDESVRLQALFELARNAIEAGCADQAPAAIEAFRVQAEKIAPQQKAEITAAVARLQQHLRARTKTTQPAK